MLDKNSLEYTVGFGVWTRRGHFVKNDIDLGSSEFSKGSVGELAGVHSSQELDVV